MKINKVIIGLSLILCSAAAMAGEKEDAAKIKKVFSQIIPNVTPEVISPSFLPGIYEVVYGANVMYISADGRYIVQGDVIDLQKRENLTENTRTNQRKKLVQKMDENTMVVFKPKGETKHTITVFTDIDCGYCRKLHREMETYLEKGIKVRYLAFPRSGPNTPSYFKAVTVWCSDDKQKAMTQAKSGEKQDEKKCKNPVDEHMRMAEDFGVSGTPTIVLDSGEVIPGYVPAERLEKILTQG